MTVPARKPVVALVLALTASACISVGGGPKPPPASVGGKPVIRIASFDFPESVLLAEMYGLALRSHGFPVSLSLDLGAREIVQPALQQGLVDLVPEYGGSALEFVTLGRVQASNDPAATHDRLSRAVSRRGVMALDPAPAQDHNAVVVTAKTAARRGLRSIDDLARVSARLVFGGPPECPTRPLCLPGLERTYGLKFHQFLALDASGPYTVNALKNGAVDAALLFSTDGAISKNGFVVLRDDRGLQPAENVTPMLRRLTASAYGPGLVSLIDAVSRKLTTGGLASMNRSAAIPGHSPAGVARAWLEEHGLVR
jgi:osmoprotectant transport system substrate-binding protein